MHGERGVRRRIYRKTFFKRVGERLEVICTMALPVFLRGRYVQSLRRKWKNSAL